MSGELLPDLTVDLLRAALIAADYSYDGVSAVLGDAGRLALSRNETTPGLRATRNESALATLTRLWPLQAGVSLDAATMALPGLVEPLCAAGILERSVDEVRALVDVRPYADDMRDWWVVSDLTPGLDGSRSRIGADHVLGVSAASSSLAQLTVRDPARRALDLGTGCGVQALHLSEHVDEVVATDVNARALAMARLGAVLNEVRVDLRAGGLFDPVAGQRFDLVVSNPPFVVSPATEERLVYRDSGLPGDELVRRLVSGVHRHLEPGGFATVLANWVHRRGEPWQERVSGWLQHNGCDAWVVQREVTDPAQYVELWLKDAGLHGTAEYVRRYDAWLDWFEEQDLEAVGFGWFNLRRVDREPVLHLEEWPYEVALPLGGEVAGRARRTDFLAATDDRALLAARLVVAADVRQDTEGQPGAEHPATIVLRQQRGMRRARRADTVIAGFVGACDGQLSTGRILDALATILDRDPSSLRQEHLAEVRDLVADGFLTPAAPGMDPSATFGSGTDAFPG
jgi:cyclopropane fatty-acyl-phospholipid synthase-like methyltransferase